MSQSQRGTGLLSRQGKRQGNGGGVGKLSSASAPDLPAAALSLHLHQTDLESRTAQPQRADTVCTSLGAAMPSIQHLPPMIQHRKLGHSPSPFKYNPNESVQWLLCFKRKSWPTLYVLSQKNCNSSFPQKTP